MAHKNLSRPNPNRSRGDVGWLACVVVFTLVAPTGSEATTPDACTNRFEWKTRSPRIYRPTLKKCPLKLDVERSDRADISNGQSRVGSAFASCGKSWRWLSYDGRRFIVRARDVKLLSPHPAEALIPLLRHRTKANCTVVTLNRRSRLLRLSGASADAEVVGVHFLPQQTPLVVCRRVGSQMLVAQREKTYFLIGKSHVTPTCAWIPSQRIGARDRDSCLVPTWSAAVVRDAKVLVASSVAGGWPIELPIRSGSPVIVWRRFRGLHGRAWAHVGAQGGDGLLPMNALRVDGQVRFARTWLSSKRCSPTAQVIRLRRRLNAKQLAIARDWRRGAGMSGTGSETSQLQRRTVPRSLRLAAGMEVVRHTDGSFEALGATFSMRGGRARTVVKSVALRVPLDLARFVQQSGGCPTEDEFNRLPNGWQVDKTTASAIPDAAKPYGVQSLSKTIGSVQAVTALVAHASQRFGVTTPRSKIARTFDSLRMPPTKAELAAAASPDWRDALDVSSLSSSLQKLICLAKRSPGEFLLKPAFSARLAEWQFARAIAADALSAPTLARDFALAAAQSFAAQPAMAPWAAIEQFVHISVIKARTSQNISKILGPLCLTLKRERLCYLAAQSALMTIKDGASPAILGELERRAVHPRSHALLGVMQVLSAQPQIQASLTHFVSALRQSTLRCRSCGDLTDALATQMLRIAVEGNVGMAAWGLTQLISPKTMMRHPVLLARAALQAHQIDFALSITGRAIRLQARPDRAAELSLLYGLAASLRCRFSDARRSLAKAECELAGLSALHNVVDQSDSGHVVSGHDVGAQIMVYLRALHRRLTKAMRRSTGLYELHRLLTRSGACEEFFQLEDEARNLHAGGIPWTNIPAMTKSRRARGLRCLRGLASINGALLNRIENLRTNVTELRVDVGTAELRQYDALIQVPTAIEKLARRCAADVRPRPVAIGDMETAVSRTSELAPSGPGKNGCRELARCVDHAMTWFKTQRSAVSAVRTLASRLVDCRNIAGLPVSKSLVALTASRMCLMSLDEVNAHKF